MYGGVSLAIYINGVAQELLQMVKATAPRPGEGRCLHTEDSLKDSTAAVYREAAQLLEYGKPAQVTEPPDANATIRTRFVVDIISGTSAGGINGIFLAKALANDQDISQLKDLWFDEADIAKLVNDAKSYSKKDGMDGVNREHPPTSVLNSKRMYKKLLEALDGMDVRSKAGSPLVDELDLSITTTDVLGVTVPLDLFDRFVFEKRHAKAFHFGRRKSGEGGRDQFSRKFNPFLAFAARCTSAFPVAFEPMCLEDIDEVLKSPDFKGEYADQGSRSADWIPYFKEYLKPGEAETLTDSAEKGTEDSDLYLSQAFADGGYLDNKPFSWAIDTVVRRRSAVPVDRRLIYVEPDPGAPRVSRHRLGERGDLADAWEAYGPLAHRRPDQTERPNAIDNAAAALLGIPRYEPIREDLERVTDLNKQADDVRELGDRIDRFDPESLPKQAPLEKLSRMSAEDLVSECSIQYAAYHSLRVAAVIDWLAETITRLAGFDENADEQKAIRSVVQAWLDHRYPMSGIDEQSQYEFLIRFDLGYRFRRIAFLQERIDTELGTRQSEEPIDGPFHNLRGRLADDQLALHDAASLLRSRSEPNAELIKSVSALGLTRKELRSILKPDEIHDSEDTTETAQDEPRSPGVDPPQALDSCHAWLKAGTRRADIDALMELIAQKLDPALSRVRSNQTLEIWKLPENESGALLKRSFEHFELYDSIRFPVSYRNVSTTDRVAVVRISPHDATSIIDETKVHEKRRKLAGTAIGHFGGFFDRTWRRNDLLWGRLDTAERILGTILPEGPTLDGLVERAQLIIIEEEFGEEREELAQAVANAMLAKPRESSTEAATTKVPTPDSERVKALLMGLQSPDEILAFLKSGYEVNRDLDRHQLLGTTGRATVVTGDVLDGLSKQDTTPKLTRWISRIGRLIWGFAEVATERSLAGLLSRWWAQLIALSATLLVVTGAVLGLPEAARIGWIVLAALLVLKVLGWIVTEATLSGGAGSKVLRVAVLIAVLVGLASTVWTATQLGGSASRWVDRQVCDLPDDVTRTLQDGWPLDDGRCSG